jgi:hypothetical protein
MSAPHHSLYIRPEVVRITGSVFATLADYHERYLVVVLLQMLGNGSLKEPLRNLRDTFGPDCTRRRIQQPVSVFHDCPVPRLIELDAVFQYRFRRVDGEVPAQVAVLGARRQRDGMHQLDRHAQSLSGPNRMAADTWSIG